MKRQKMEAGVEEDLEGEKSGGLVKVGYWLINELCYVTGDWYNYGNANDKLNYCPAVDDVSGVCVCV